MARAGLRAATANTRKANRPFPSPGVKSLGWDSWDLTPHQEGPQPPALALLCCLLPALPGWISSIFIPRAQAELPMLLRQQMTTTPNSVAQKRDQVSPGKGHSGSLSHFAQRKEPAASPNTATGVKGEHKGSAVPSSARPQLYGPCSFCPLLHTDKSWWSCHCTPLPISFYCF